MCGCAHPSMSSEGTHHGEPPQVITAVGQSPARASSVPCPGCGLALQEDFVFCPRCGRQVLTACPQCHRATRADWSHCAFCGADLVAAPAHATQTTA